MKNQKNLINLKKSKSLIDKIISMVESDKYCVDIMQQNLAVIGLLKAVNRSILAGHLQSCFSNAVKNGNQSRINKMIDEILRLDKMSGR